jgi:ubiquitin-conjugating enzyme E2 D/E
VEEYKDINRNPLSNMRTTIGLPNGDYYEWTASYIGPKDSPYARGVFHIKLLFPHEYPNKGPDIIFLTPIYHLNVNRIKSKNGSELLGHVSVSFINWWKPETTVKEILTKLYAIFYWSNPYSPYGLDIAEENINNRQLYEQKVKYFTRKYANPMKKLKLDDQDWDFSYDEKDLEAFHLKEQKENEKKKEKDNNDDITLVFSDNGRTTTTIQCRPNELMRDIIQRCLNKFGISKNLTEILLISCFRSLNMNISVKDNKLKNNYQIDIIYDALFAV